MKNLSLLEWVVGAILLTAAGFTVFAVVKNLNRRDYQPRGWSVQDPYQRATLDEIRNILLRIEEQGR